MSTQHTPGPWFIWQELAMQREGMEPDEITDELLYDNEFGIYAGNPKSCTRSLINGHSAHICDIDPDDHDFDDDEKQEKATALANARLIAAAPDLLEFAEWVLSLKSGGMIEGRARAAIAKATGAQA